MYTSFKHEVIIFCIAIIVKPRFVVEEGGA